ncbi:hypothetical protein [Nonomuraea sp. NPDC049725]|uniref:hypothetical protein n=1 Tax=Nonomuraea sp. NPDC049725 TaxID=3154508 RepID=UPI00341777BC
MKNMVPSKTDQLPTISRPGLPVHSLAKDQPEISTAERAKCVDGSEAQVNLQQLPKKKSAIDRGTGLKIEVMQRPKLVVNEGVPVAHHAEEQIDVRPAVGGGPSCGSSDRSTPRSARPRAPARAVALAPVHDDSSET